MSPPALLILLPSGPAPVGAAAEERAAKIARVLGCTLLEARPHAAAEAPRVIVTRPAAAELEPLSAALNGEGLASVVVTGDVIAPESKLLARRLRLDDVGVTGEDAGREVTLPWSALAVLAHGVSVATTTHVHQDVKHVKPMAGIGPLSALRAATQVQVQRQTVSREQRRAWAGVRGDDGRVILVVEGETHFEGDEFAPQQAGIARVLAFAEMVRARAPQVRFDNRLLTQAGRTMVMGALKPLADADSLARDVILRFG